MKKLFSLSVGFLVVSGLMVLVDCWGYGQFVFTPYEYLKVNIFEDKVSSFGKSPWWFYLNKTVIKLLPFWGLAAVFGIFLLIRDFFKNELYKKLLIFIFLFLVIHHLIGHKELRFLYPIFIFTLIPFSHWLSSQKELVKKIFFRANYVIIPFLLLPAYKPYGIYDFLYNHKEISKISYLGERTPFDMKSLVRKDLNVEKFDAASEDQSFYVITENYKEFKSLNTDFKCSVEKSTVPLFLFNFNYFNWLNRSNIWTISHCQNP
jgi:phosphatidylinositol glycan class B